MKKLVVLTILSISSLFAVPTEQRDWKSTAGTTITAEALKVRKSAAYRAHYWCNFLQKEYKISGPNAEILATLFGELSEDPINARYTEGVAEIDEFSGKYYVSEGTDGGSKFDHTSSRIESAAEKLARDYPGVPVIEEVAKKLGEPTVGK